MSAGEAGRLEGDVRVALLTGAVGWRDHDSAYTAAELVTVGVLATSVVGVVTILVMSAGLPPDDAALTGAARWVMAAAGTVTLLVGVSPAIAWPFGWRPRGGTPVWVLAAVRVVAALVVVGCWTALLGPTAPAPAWGAGIVVGCESALTAWSLGVRPDGVTWWWRFQLSSLHAGILLASLAVVAVDRDRLTDVLIVLLTFQVIALAAAVTAHVVERVRAALDSREQQTHRQVATAAHRDLAHWLHDEVTSSLRLLRFRLQSEVVPPAAIRAALDDLDHRLRLRQLEEVIAGGSAQLAELLQPYVRLAQDHDVAVVEVPRFEEAAITVESDAGWLVQRALGVLVPNAIAAGARHLAFRVASEPRGFAIEVEDDAGGFDLAGVPAGRALDGLQRDLGPGGMTCERVNGGTRVCVTIARDGGVR